MIPESWFSFTKMQNKQYKTVAYTEMVLLHKFCSDVEILCCGVCRGTRELQFPEFSNTFEIVTSGLGIKPERLSKKNALHTVCLRILMGATEINHRAGLRVRKTGQESNTLAEGIANAAVN